MREIQNLNAAGALEFDKILDKSIEEAVSDPGREALRGLHFLTDAVALRAELTRVTEMRDCLRYDDAFPFSEFSDVRAEVKKAEVEGAFLRSSALLAIKQLLVLTRNVKAFFSQRSDKYPLLQQTVRAVVPLADLEREIDRVIDPSAEIRDRASDNLYRIRQAIRKKESDARRRLEGILREMTVQGHAQEDHLALRDGRLVIPIKESAQSRLKGVVVDQSASGATVFVEPWEIVEMNNAVRRLKIQETVEEEEILRRLTGDVRQKRDAILANRDTAVELDALRARARFSLTVQGEAGLVSENGWLELKDARHPLLLLKSGRNAVVPLNLELGGDRITLVVTGPNAGGKTVSLKTVGLLALMHQHGFHVPVREGSSFPLFTGVFADIGDRQSIEQDLSTFSSHVQSIKTILEQADSRCLVLLDEIGSATDPDEGAALARTILRNLTQRGVLTLATTHLGALKMFAHDEPGVENASMAFDQKTLRPTYRFQIGIPGASYAFEIAERFGLPKSLIQDARAVAGSERGRLDSLVSTLESENRRIHDLLSEAEIKESRLSGLIALYDEKINALRADAAGEKKRILEDAEELLRETNRTVERVLREIRESKGEAEAVRRARVDLEALKQTVASSKEAIPKRQALPCRPGDTVVWLGHGGKARVLTEPDAKGKLWIQWENLKVQVPVTDCGPSGGGAESGADRVHASYSIQTDVRDEIDLRGMTVDESLEALDRYLSDAVAAGLGQVRIIHGKGTGTLRREIGKYLSGHTLVRSRRLGHWNEGDTGVTVVEFQ